MADQGQKKRQTRANCTRLCGGENAHIKPTDNAGNNDNQRTGQLKRSQFFPQRKTIMFHWCQRRIAPHGNPNRDTQNEGEDKAGNEARNQQTANAAIGENAIDHHQCAGRYHHGKRASNRNGCRGQPLVVSPVQHLRQRKFGEQGRRAHRRAGSCAKCRRPQGR